MSSIDIKEQGIADLSIDLLKILLADKTTGQYLKWATDNYISFGPSYYPHCEMFPEQIIGKNTEVVQPRVSKSKDEQIKRTRDKAEVFTPSWVCNLQNNLVDDIWFGKSNVFNVCSDKTWVSTVEAIAFPDGKDWKQYVDIRRLEVSCGEAPYLVSRYDTVSGDQIEINRRVGLLDRKLRVVSENTSSEDDWIKWAFRAYQSVYGYEYQGDNVLLARENLLFTFVDYYEDRFNKKPEVSLLKKIANVIAWNIWQMDGLTYQTPFSEVVKEEKQLSLFELLGEEAEKPQVEALYSVVRDWRSEVTIEFRDTLKGE